MRRVASAPCCTREFLCCLATYWLNNRRSSLRCVSDVEQHRAQVASANLHLQNQSQQFYTLHFANFPRNIDLLHLRLLMSRCRSNSRRTILWCRYFFTILMQTMLQNSIKIRLSVCQNSEVSIRMSSTCIYFNDEWVAVQREPHSLSSTMGYASVWPCWKVWLRETALVQKQADISVRSTHEETQTAHTRKCRDYRLAGYRAVIIAHAPTIGLESKVQQPQTTVLCPRTCRKSSLCMLLCMIQ